MLFPGLLFNVNKIIFNTKTSAFQHLIQFSFNYVQERTTTTIYLIHMWFEQTNIIKTWQWVETIIRLALRHSGKYTWSIIPLYSYYKEQHEFLTVLVKTTSHIVHPLHGVSMVRVCCSHTRREQSHQQALMPFLEYDFYQLLMDETCYRFHHSWHVSINFLNRC